MGKTRAPLLLRTFSRKKLASATAEVSSVTDSRWCATCRQLRPAGEFYPVPGMRDGVSSRCRSCRAAAAKSWRERNPEHVEARNVARRIGPAEHRCELEECGRMFEGRRDARYCRDACRARARYLRRRGLPSIRNSVTRSARETGVRS